MPADDHIFKTLLLTPASEKKTNRIAIFIGKIRRVLTFLETFLLNLLAKNGIIVDGRINFCEDLQYFSIEDEILTEKDSFWRIVEKIYEKYGYDAYTKYLAFSINSGKDEKIKCEAAGNLALITLNDEDLECLIDGEDILKLLEREISKNLEQEREKMKVSRIIGTVLHEIGHVLDLGHVKNTVMSGDYWKIGRYIIEGTFGGFRCFDEDSLAIIGNHRWMNPDRKPARITEKTIVFDQKNRTVRCEDEIYIVQIRRSEDGETLYSRIFDNKGFYPTKIWTLPDLKTESSAEDRKIVVFVMLRSGNTARFVTGLEK